MPVERLDACLCCGALLSQGVESRLNCCSAAAGGNNNRHGVVIRQRVRVLCSCAVGTIGIHECHNECHNEYKSRYLAARSNDVAICQRPTTLNGALKGGLP